MSDLTGLVKVKIQTTNYLFETFFVLFIQTDHVMLTDRGAGMFAERIGTPVAHDLVTEPERKEWEHNKSYQAGVKTLFNTQWWVISCLLPN